MKKNKLILFAFCFLCRSTSGQTVWNLDDCVRFALANNNQLQSYRSNRLLADNREKSARLSWLPTISASMGHYAGFGQSPSYNGLYIHHNAYTMLTDISFSMPVFSGLSQHWQRLAAKQESRIACLQERAFEDELVATIIRSYYQCVAQTEKMAFANRQLEVCRQQRTTLEALFSMGKVEEATLMECDARMAVCEKEAITARGQLASDLLILCRNMGIKETFAPAFPKKEDFPDVKELVLSSPQEIYASAVRQDAAVLAARTRVDQYRSLLKEQQALFFPQISLVAGYSNGFYAYQSAAYAGFSDQWLQNGRLSFGISLHFPIFGGTGQPYALSNAKLRIDLEKQALEYAESQLWYTIRQYYLLTITSREKYEACEKNYEATVGMGEHAKANYEATKITFSEYQNYLSLVFQSYTEKVDAWCNLLCHYQMLALYGGFYTP